MAKSVYEQSPFGVFQHPWLNKPDTKFAAAGTKGVFKVHLHMTGPGAQAFKEKLDALAEEAKERFFTEGQGKDMKPSERQKWSIHVPYTDVRDPETDELTGETAFHFKQNAEISFKDRKSGERITKDITIGILDSDNQPVTKPVFSGSEGRIMYSARDIVQTSSKLVGVRLDFALVQVTKLQQGGGGPQGFGKVEGGYVDEGEQAHGREEAGDEKVEY